MTDAKDENDVGNDPTFRDNVRRQLQAKGAEGTPDPRDTYVPMVQMEPSEGRAARWFGSVVGAALFLFGAFWFMAIIGYPFPWYTLFPVLGMFVGGFLIAAAIATGRPQKR